MSPVPEVEIGAETFEISFVRTPETQEYLIPVDRVWFWLAAESSGLVPHVQLPQGVAVRQKMVNKAPPQPVLY
jgi:hypothetical protein